MDLRIARLLLASCLAIGVSMRKDYFTLGQQDLATNVKFNEVKLTNGLYSLGEVKEDGSLESICARGRVVKGKRNGILLFYFLRESNGILKVKSNFYFETKQECEKKFNILYAPKKGDIIALYMGSNKIKKKRKKFRLLSIAFSGETASYKFFEESSIFNETSYDVERISDKLESLLFSRENMTLLKDVQLNVQVRIRQLSKNVNVIPILAAVAVCIIFLALLSIIVLLVVKTFKKSPRHIEYATRLREIPSIEVCNYDAEDLATKDFGDVNYLLQKGTKQAVISMAHYHGKVPESVTRRSKVEHTYSLLNEPCDSTGETALLDHDYDEPYFEPACTEDTLLKQLKVLGVPLIAKETLKLHSDDVLGRGAFGSVHRGVLYSVLEFNKLTEEEVAVKTLEDTTSEEDRVKFLQEAAIMGQFSHPNIIKILGIVISPDSCKLVIEVMSHGDLRNHLHTIKPDEFKQELAPTLLSYSRHVANGMMYLAMKSFVHRDLAARNVLVAEDGVCKIADFGLSRKLQDEDYYVSHGGKIPVKWTAPEALHYRKYSTASDVWSYGCVLYEIWSLGEKPYHDLANEQIIEKLSSGFRLSPPPGCPREVYKIMIQCWHSDPVQRPSFMDITAQLQKPDYQVLKWKEDPEVSGDTSSSSKEARVIGAALEAGFQLYQDLQKTYYDSFIVCGKY